MISQTATYALRAIAYIARNDPDKPVLASHLAAQLGIPQNYLSKIMHRLVQAGFLLSKRGTNGGFILAKEPRKIAMIDIISLFMNTEQFDHCFLGGLNCDGSCGLHKQWKPIMGAFKRLINNNTIDKLL